MGQPQNRESQEPAPGAEENVVDQGTEEPQEKVYFVGGRDRTADELARDFAASTEENRRLQERLENLESRMKEVPTKSEPKRPTWVNGLVEAGVPDAVADEMFGWVESQVDSRTRAATAEQLAGLVENLSSMANADSASDATLMSDPTMEGYTPEGLKALLAKDRTGFKQRYDRIFQVDPEGAKRLAWVTLKGEAKPRGGGRMTTPPQSRRQAQPVQDEKVLKELLKSAREGAPGDLKAFMAAKLAKYSQPEE